MDEIKVEAMGDWTLPPGKYLPASMAQLLDMLTDEFDAELKDGKGDWDRESVLEWLVWRQAELEGLAITD